MRQAYDYWQDQPGSYHQRLSIGPLLSSLPPQRQEGAETGPPRSPQTHAHTNVRASSTSTGPHVWLWCFVNKPSRAGLVSETFNREAQEMRGMRPAPPASAGRHRCATIHSPISVFLGPSNNNSICLLALLSSFRRQATNRHVAAGGPTVQGTAIQNGISNRNQSVANHTAGLLASRFDTTASHRVSARSLHPSPTPHTAAQAQDVRRR